jgi:hypothetical protein
VPGAFAHARSCVSTLNRVLARQEKEIIETALEECYGQVSGPSGAATKLGLPTRTLDSKIKRFKINKYRFLLRDQHDFPRGTLFCCCVRLVRVFQCETLAKRDRQPP